jgi:hypothetical protein
MSALNRGRRRSVARDSGNLMRPDMTVSGLHLTHRLLPTTTVVGKMAQSRKVS